MTQFLLNQQPVVLENVDPNLTVLNWLRNDRRRCGTKEGCASGDCGACTVVIGSVEEGKMRYRSANGCLLLVAQLEGKQLLTVEDLADGGELHPVQKEMACGHASQCGFCTPGIVMSTFALCHSGEPATAEAIHHHLGGNLCRCTGYRPIVDAAARLLASPKPDAFSAASAATADRLAQMAAQPQAQERVLMPASADALADALLRYPQARLLAGGTDLNLLVTQAYRPHQQLIALQGVPELRGIRRRGAGLEIGAMTTLSDLQQGLRESVPAFSEMLGRFASQQVRNQGTLGGNIANASPIGDCPPALLALDARLRLRRGSAVREVALADFFTGYRQTLLQESEFISHILIDDVTMSHNLRLWKVSKRREDDISAVFGAICIERDGEMIRRARVAFGGMAAIPARAYRCEALLSGKPFTRATLAAAAAALAEDFTPMSDVRASSGYRLQVAKNLLARYYLDQTATCAVEVSDVR